MVDAVQSHSERVHVVMLSPSVEGGMLMGLAVEHRAERKHNVSVASYASLSVNYTIPQSWCLCRVLHKVASDGGYVYRVVLRGNSEASPTVTRINFQTRISNDNSISISLRFLPNCPSQLIRITVAWSLTCSGTLRSLSGDLHDDATHEPAAGAR